MDGIGRHCGECGPLAASPGLLLLLFCNLC